MAEGTAAYSDVHCSSQLLHARLAQNLAACSTSLIAHDWFGLGSSGGHLCGTVELHGANSQRWPHPSLLAAGDPVLNLYVSTPAGLLVAGHQEGSPSAHGLIQPLLPSHLWMSHWSRPTMWPGPELDGRELQEGTDTGK